MKKITTIVLALTLALVVVASAACKPDNPTLDISQTESQSSAASSGERYTVKAAALRGPTGVSMLKLMEDSEKGATANPYEFSIYSDPTDVSAKIINGEFDVAALPTNLAAVLYQKTNKKIKIVALDTLGVLYLLENGEAVKSVADLKGKTVTMAVAGQGATPEFALKYILGQNGLDPEKDVTIEYRGEHSDVAALAVSGEVKICLLPEPNVTPVLSGNASARVALDITKEWKSAAEKTGSPQGELAMSCIVATQDFISAHNTEFDAFMAEYKASCEYVTSNPDDTAALAEKFTVIPKAAVAKKAIPNCNIVYIDGADMQARAAGYLEVLYGFAPASVGGELPDEQFYYKK
ncbi:MAG: ABC transporter substrate-binding protein [Oscillospiraceae bacterium]|jgi:NitT/TauT family transport system substrate-binding protein|nr:ABC transporter substrate-binding protein [Oscillospiraceae bacterium]